MSFPQTRLTLIQRLVESGEEADWARFLEDYWRPLSRFAQQRGNLQPADADDLVSATFEVLVRNRLVERWSENRSAKLRTLLCTVIRKQLANHHRRARKHHEIPISTLPEADQDESKSDENVFLGLWIDEILQRTLDSLRSACLAEGKVDQFRVLYGRICESMTHAEIAECLGIPETTAQAWYKQCRNRLAECLQSQVVSLTRQYAAPEEFETEFQQEWNELGDFLKQHGGLEEAIRRAAAVNRDPPSDRWRPDSSRLTTLTQMILLSGDSKR